MSYTLTQYINEIRASIGDAFSTTYEEDWTSLLVGGNGTRTTFPLSHAYILTGQTNAYTSNGGAYTSTGYTINVGTSSNVQFSSAPALGSLVGGVFNPSSLKFKYSFQSLTDSVNWSSLNLGQYDIDSFINKGLAKLNLNQIFVDTSYANVTAPQFMVICLYGKAYGYDALSSYYARTVTQSAEGKSSAKSEISKNYQNLHKEALADAEKERLALYGPRQGDSTVARYKSQQIVPTSAFYTPGR